MLTMCRKECHMDDLCRGNTDTIYLITGKSTLFSDKLSYTSLVLVVDKIMLFLL